MPEAVSEQDDGRARRAGQLVGDTLASGALAVWNRFQPPEEHPWAPSPAASDNVQRTMNLIMPLRRGHVLLRGRLLRDLVRATDMIVTGLNNVGTVHFARFVLVGRHLCMISVYDGELSGYIRDFIGTIGQAFDAIMTHVRKPPPTPVAAYPDQFIDWIAAHDAFQFPDEPTDLCPHLNRIERENLLVLRQNRNVQIGVYRCYPGYSAARIRHDLGTGW